MLVTLAVLLLMMTVIVKIFQAATGALSSAQAYQELDNQLRQLDATIRSDLNGVTCKLTPPNNPQNNPGYLEYGENEFADVQGEDSDDYIRFTAKAPAGRPFTGRMWVPPPNSASLADLQCGDRFSWPATSRSRSPATTPRSSTSSATATSTAASCSWPPSGSRSIVPTINNQATIVRTRLATSTLDRSCPSGLGGTLAVSWQGMNDLSAHPAPTGPDPNALNTHNSIILNTLGDLTNRENRFAYQRFANDFQNLAGDRRPG